MIWPTPGNPATGKIERRFDRAIDVLLLALLLFAPLTFGVVEAWSEQVVVVLAAAISITFATKLVVVRSPRFLWSWTYVPIAVFIGLIVFQLIPLPAGLVSVISTNTATIKTELLSDLPNAERVLSRMNLTFYPHATKHDLRLIISIAGVFVVVVNTYRTPSRIKRLLMAIATIGGSLALLAFAQDIFGNGRIYWFVPTYGQACSGPFVNHSHYGQFMNLSIGAALGLIFVQLHEAFAGTKITSPIVADYLSSAKAKLIWILAAMIILSAATIFISLTRGGMVSLLIAGAFTTLLLSSRQSLKGRSWIMALMVLGAFICVLYIGFDAVYDRLATLREIHHYKGRWQIVRDICTAWTKFPIFGTGMGTHEVVYPMFDRSTIASLASHAENEYAQAAEETGLVGLISLAAFGVFVWTSFARSIRKTRTPIYTAAYGLGFGLLAVTLHSFSDFGQHLPANALLTAVFCALLLSLTSIERNNEEKSSTPHAHSGFFIRRVFPMALITGAFAWALWSANGARLAETHWHRTLAAEQQLMEANWNGTDEQYRHLISSASAASEADPDNIKYRHWLNVYRWHSISRLIDPNSGDVLISEQTREFARRIAIELSQARVLCPTFGATWSVLGQLESHVLHEGDGVCHIKTGYRLSPCDATACLLAAQLEADTNNTDSAFAMLKRALLLDGKLFSDIAVFCTTHMNRADFAVELAADSTHRLSCVANILTNSSEYGHLAQEARSQIVKLLESKCEQDDAPAWAFASLASIYKRRTDNEAALEYYRRAVALDYGNIHWRLSLAELLADVGAVPEAIHEARICLRLRPQFATAKRLIEKLSVRSDGFERP